MKNLFLFSYVFILFLTSFSPINAEELVLRRTQRGALVDGQVMGGEYTLSQELNGLALYMSRTSDSIYVAISAQTKGWVAIGFNSLIMDKAQILIGYVKGGNAVLKENIGKGHTHPEDALGYVKNYAMNESGGQTTLEVECKLDRLWETGEDTLKLLVVYGQDDSMSSYHRFRKSLLVKFED